MTSKFPDPPESEPTGARTLPASFRYAFQGLLEVLRTQRNSRIHAFATVVVILAGILFRLEWGDWSDILLAIALVWVTEMINSALEKISDRVDPEFHPLIKASKDIAAAAVLLAALAAVLVGLATFGPIIRVLLSRP